MKYDAAVKRNEILIHTRWTNFKISMFSERSPTQKTMCCIIPFTRNSRKGKTNSRKQITVCLGQGWRRGMSAKGLEETF